MTPSFPLTRGLGTQTLLQSTGKPPFAHLDFLLLTGAGTLGANRLFLNLPMFSRWSALR